MSDTPTSQRQELMAAYMALDKQNQDIINLLAANWGALNQSQLKTGLNISPKQKLEISTIEKRGLIVREKMVGISLSNSGIKCHPAIIELVARHLVTQSAFGRYAELARKAWPLERFQPPRQEEIRFASEDQLIREVRFGLYEDDPALITRAFESLRQNRYLYWGGWADRWSNPAPIYARVCANPFDPNWFQALPPSVQKVTLPLLPNLLALEWRMDEATYHTLADLGRDNPACQPGLAFAALLRGDAAGAMTHLAASAAQPVEIAVLGGLLRLLQGDEDAAIKHFGEAVRLHRRETGQRRGFLPGIAGAFYVVALMIRNQGKDFENANTLLDNVDTNHPQWAILSLMRYGFSLESGNADSLKGFREKLKQNLTGSHATPWLAWFGLLILARYDEQPDISEYLPVVLAFRERAEQHGLAWPAAELGVLLARLDPSQGALAEAAAEFRDRPGLRLLADRFRHEAPWERALNAIRNTVTAPPAEASAKPVSQAEMRLAWLVFESQGHYSVEAREQKLSAQGVWSKGRVVALKKLGASPEDFAYLSSHDRRVIGHIAMEYSYGYAYNLTEKGWLTLAGHPAVYWGHNGASLELVATPPELRVRKQRNGQIRIELWPKKKLTDQRLLITKDGLNRLKLTEFKPEHQRLATIVGDGFEAPATAQERILTGLGAVSSLVAIHSDIGTAEASGAESVPADPRPRVQLAPEGEGLRVAVLVRPFGEQGSYYPPGSGGAGLMAEINGKRLQTERNLKLERQLAADVMAACPGFPPHVSKVDGYQWHLEDPESSLELLLELGQVGEQAVVEWPQGEKLKVLGQAGLNQMSLAVKRQRDWFSVSGELKLDDGEVLSLQRLLELIGDQKGRFVRLDGDRFLALTESFRKRLEDLRAYTESHGGGQRLHPLAASVLDDMAGDVGDFKADAAWREQLERLKQAGEVRAELPSTLQAELRDYQRDGYVWLSRLAAWGVGACLADDMGLGKTVQALALMLSRAADGPSLVLAPTSVGFNWLNEAGRFAPTLKLRTLGATNDRQALVEGLGAMDVLVCSYGLLQQESVGELLATVRWRTIVLDEAQAIKNAATRRSQQAMNLQGDFKLITTGTPVENHLGELWNLFRFINPGLLGSLESFNRRFAGPIERDQDREARRRLKRLIQPFILRRTKTQVLEELPARTDIELQVELSEKEAAFYEALRRKLLDELNETGGPIEDQRFKVLAAITKLRRACCNPNLIAPELGLSSSKLALFGEVLEELLENRHKSLVFSQFVDHLSLVRAYLDEKGVAYQYLDGSTPAPERKKRVEGFQAGQGDVFLISLKAGGTGLNLTAADYVIHLDPWWNPAVEDQASDRAHRIGQTRPVTVYRLVAGGTIEQKIVALHRQKRELADSLLEDGDISGKVGADELLQLMREG
ncbi:DEAD/DEAH box helicase [Methylomagnum sp.]